MSGRNEQTPERFVSKAVKTMGIAFRICQEQTPRFVLKLLKQNQRGFVKYIKEQTTRDLS